MLPNGTRVNGFDRAKFVAIMRELGVETPKQLSTLLGCSRSAAIRYLEQERTPSEYYLAILRKFVGDRRFLEMWP